ncbi:hypothetical protein FWK35_00013971 [Aphis craccivora]|uniref:Uncharacterized protein n=1 Tax=Aphis craccivora TaxID=307492 RepID=A0A6G0YEY7_APHCR|nr:hypothetical protein FWK35_00013971 [Aphis craccivora]
MMCVFFFVSVYSLLVEIMLQFGGGPM